MVAYSTKAGLKNSLNVEQAEIDPATYLIDLPTDFLYMDSVVDLSEAIVSSQTGTRIDGEDTIKTLKFIPETDLSEYTYPLQLVYFSDLLSFDRVDELPNHCDVNLLIDYLESIVGIPNAQLYAAIEVMDINTRQKTITEYSAQKQECERMFTNIQTYHRT